QSPSVQAGGFLLFWEGGKMNDCPRRYTQKNAAYRSVSPDLTKPVSASWRVFAFWGGQEDE
ncbi:hypothetical protein RCT46_02495, partial [Escherichia marmotae]|nr:hypothetical protein [Escherichia marmotae]